MNKSNSFKKSISKVNNKLDTENDEEEYIKYNKNSPKIKYFENVQCEKSYFIFSKKNPIRRFCYVIIKNPKFEDLVLM